MQMADSTDEYESELAKAQLEKLTLENEKFRLELSNLKTRSQVGLTALPPVNNGSDHHGRLWFWYLSI